MDVGGDIIVVSQFTLHAQTKKGNRPSYIKAAKPDVAIPLYEEFVKVHNTIPIIKNSKVGNFLGQPLNILLGIGILNSQ